MADIQTYICRSCGKKEIQPKRICARCHSKEFETETVKGEGNVYSYTVIHISSEEFSEITPYTIALIEIEKGLRVTGRVNTSVAIGDLVSCVSTEDQIYIFEKV